MPVRERLDFFLFEFRFVFFDAGTLDDYFAVFCLLRCKFVAVFFADFMTVLLAFQADFQQHSAAGAFAGVAERNIW
jgi:hypothetical protein